MKYCKLLLSHCTIVKNRISDRKKNKFESFVEISGFGAFDLQNVCLYEWP